MISYVSEFQKLE